MSGEEITTGFLLKVVAVLILAGTIFGYYLSDLRYREIRPIRTYFGVGGWVLVIAAVVFGFSVFGSPQPNARCDLTRERVNDLQIIQSYIIGDWQAKTPHRHPWMRLMTRRGEWKSLPTQRRASRTAMRSFR